VKKRDTMSNLKDVRTARGLTQEQLADLSGIEQAVISALETGRNRSPGWRIVGRLARALDVRPEEIFPVEVGTNA